MMESSSQGIFWGIIEPPELARIIQQGLEKVLVIDSRSFLEFNTCHIVNSVNVCCSKLVKRRLQQDKVHIKDLLTQTCHIEDDESLDIIVYDQCTEDTSQLTEDNFLIVLLQKLSTVFKSVTLLKGGYLVFQAMHPVLCENKSNKCSSLTSLSQPCLPVSNVGPTRILHFMYLGSQWDSMSQETTQVNGISYILNVTTTCKKPPFIQDSHFHRIPVNDNYSAKMTPYFQEAFQFLDKVREANGCVLIHCLAGISRSPTLAIAYVMKHLKMSSDDAYRYVKDKRPTISPNFNFLGQLLDYEKQLKAESESAKRQLEALGRSAEESKGSIAMDLCSNTVSPKTKLLRTSSSSPTTISPQLHAIHKQTVSDLSDKSITTSLQLMSTPVQPFNFLSSSFVSSTPAHTVQSPTTALARLNFNQSIVESMEFTETVTVEKELQLHKFPTTSLDKLSFTPCFAKDESGSPARPRTTAVKRPKSSDEAEPLSPGSTSGGSSTSSSVVTSPTGNTQVTMRSRENRVKRPMVRPNSIAFSTYPTFDLGSDCQESPGSSSSTSQDDTSEAYLLNNGKKSKHSETGRWHYGRYSERHVYKQIAAAMENAMLRTRVFENSRKSRSLDDILTSGEEEPSDLDCACSPLGKLPQRCGAAADIYSSGIFDNLSCRMRGSSDTYQSSSSISSSGSHSSLHGSLEIIQYHTCGDLPHLLGSFMQMKRQAGQFPESVGLDLVPRKLDSPPLRPNIDLHHRSADSLVISLQLWTGGVLTLTMDQ